MEVPFASIGSPKVILNLLILPYKRNAMECPSNIKIQRTGADINLPAIQCLPAADLER